MRHMGVLLAEAGGIEGRRTAPRTVAGSGRHRGTGGPVRERRSATEGAAGAEQVDGGTTDEFGRDLSHAGHAAVAHGWLLVLSADLRTPSASARSSPGA